IATHWWWRDLGKGVEMPHIVLHTWLDAPEYAPAALQHLARRGKVVPFVRALGVEEVRALLHTLTWRFALPDLQSAVEAILDERYQTTRSALNTGPTMAHALHSDRQSSVLTAGPAAP